MSGNEVFYSETKSIMEAAVRAAVDVLGNSKEENSTKEESVKRKPDFDKIMEMLAREATRQISAMFSQLSSALHNQNKTLKARVEQLESELKAVSEKFENARIWRENVLKGCPILFKDSGLVFTMKLFGTVKRKTDESMEGVRESESPPAAGMQSGGLVPCADGLEAAKEVTSESASRQDASQDYVTTNKAESKNTEQEAEVEKNAKVFECEFCKKCFNQQFHLLKHMNTHIEWWPFACDRCPRRFRKSADLEQHLLFHEEKKKKKKKKKKCVTFKCHLCEKTFKTKMHLKTHQRVHTDTRPFVCSTCGKAFKSKYSLQVHQVVHTVEKPHKCLECGESFRYAFTLQCHRSVHTGEDPYKCTVCGKAFVKRRSLRAHQAVHRGKVFICEICGAGFTLQQNLKRHIRIHTGEKPFKCQVCGQSFIQDNKLKVHMLVHGASKSFMCDLCGKTFLYNCQLQKHQRISHVERQGEVIRRRARERCNRRIICRQDRTTVDVTPFSCKSCRKSFSSVASLKRHELIHVGQMQYKCDTCGRYFFYKASYDYHRRIHTGERPFACDVCGKRFIIPQALKSHKLQHSGEKPHKCEQCGKAFRIYSNYLRHFRIHTGEKPYECEVCGVRFRQLTHVKFHMQVHTGERPYSCSACGLGFSDSRLLKKHKCTEGYQKTLSETQQGLTS